MMTKLQAFAKRYYKDFLIILALIITLELWQSRRLLRGELPPELRQSLTETLDGQSSPIWSQDTTTLIYVFAPWCGVCRTSASNMNRVPSMIHSTALALSWSNQQSVEEFVESSGLKTEVLLGNDEQAYRLGVQAYPTYILIAADGRIIYSWTGYTTSFGLWVRSLLGHWLS